VIPGLTRSLYSILLIIKRYMAETGRGYVTYDGLKAYCARNRLYNSYQLTDRTLDRALRRLSELGYFERVYIKRNGRKIVLFKPTSTYYEFTRRHDEIEKAGRRV